MKLYLHRNFVKKQKHLSTKLRAKLYERLRIFQENQFNPVLNNHSLSGKWLGYRSIEVTGDIRAIFKQENSGALFVDVDNHNNLYA